MRRALLIGLLCLSGCATPQAHPQLVDRPRYFRLPASAHDHDLLCLDANLPGTCATIGEVRIVLVSRKGQP